MKNQFNLLFTYKKYIDNLLIKLSDHELKNNKKIDKNNWKKILLKLIKYPDIKIYKILRKMYKQDDCFSENRAIIMASKITNIILNVQKNKMNSMLDYGCANGTITKELGKQLNIKKIYGADIKELNNIDKNFNFILLKNNNLMPQIKNNSIDFINISMVLHHIENINETLNEFKRIISNNGIICIREHDCKDKSFGTFLDILHGLYSLVWTEPMEDPDFIQNYYANYKSYEEWDNLFRVHGFQKIYFNYKKSVINAYYAVYVPIILEDSRIIKKY